MDGVAGGRDFLVEVAQDRVVFQEVREGLGVGQIVDRDEVQLCIAQGGPENVPADPSKPIDADFQTHRECLRMKRHAPSEKRGLFAVLVNQRL